jgi:transcriptional regulator with XRE-family HTH domain
MPKKTQTIGATVRKLRLAADLNVPELAAKVGVSHQYIYYLETSQGDGIRLGTLRKIAAALEISLTQLLAGTVHEPIAK